MILFPKRDWSDAVSNIAKQFNLTEEKRISLENEVLFVLIGLEPPTDLAENMEREMAIDSNAADIIAEEVKKKIF